MPRSAPGDRLRVRLVDRKAGYGRAEILEILTAGPGRRDPPCPYFERCGGCDLQHLEEHVQLKAKAEAVRETLRRLGDVETLPKVTVVPGRPWGYRLRAQLHVEHGEQSSPEGGPLEDVPEGGPLEDVPEEGPLEDVPEGEPLEDVPEGGPLEGAPEGGPLGDVQVGYFARGSHDLVPVERCPVLVPELENALPGLAHSLAGVSHRRVDLTAGDDSRWTVSPPVAGLPQGEVQTRIGDLVYTYDARCFFQSHRQLIPALIEHVLGPETGDEEGTAYDLFAGVGLFSLPLARRFDRVIAVEGDRIANRYAKRNARLNGIKNLTVERQSDELVARDAAKIHVPAQEREVGRADAGAQYAHAGLAVTDGGCVEVAAQARAPVLEPQATHAIRRRRARARESRGSSRTGVRPRRGAARG